MPIIEWMKDTYDKVAKGKGGYVGTRGANTDEENKLLDLAIERLHIAESEKTDPSGRMLHQRWRDLDKMYRSDQWKEPSPSYKSTPVLNFTFSLVEAIVPRMTDSTPEILVLPRSPEVAEFAKMLSSVHSYLWYTNRMQQQLTESIRTCMKLGTVIYKVIWNPDALDGLGEVQYSVVHPMNFFPDPRAYTVEQMDYCFTVMPKTLEYIYRRWPDKGPKVIADQDWSHTEQLEGGGQPSKEAVATLKEYWFRDEHGHVCCMYYAGHIVLEVIGGKYDDSNEPVYRHNKFPFAKQVDYPAEKEFWGIGEIEIVELLQRLINNFEAQIIDNTRLMANAQWIINKVQSGLSEEDAWMLTNRPGGAIWTRNGGVDRAPGVPIPTHIPQHQERLIFAMEQILGIHDVVQGRQPSGVRAASAIIALQEAANVRVRQKAKNLEHTLVDLVDQATWLVLEHYDDPRQVRLTQRSEFTTLDVREALNTHNITQARQMAPEELPPEMPPIVEGMGPEEIPGEQLEELQDIIKYPEFDIEVKVGPSVPYSQALVHEMAKEFYQLNIIDRKAVLETTNFPNREEILKRMEAQEAQMMQAESEERIGERTF